MAPRTKKPAAEKKAEESSVPKITKKADSPPKAPSKKADSPSKGSSSKKADSQPKGPLTSYAIYMRENRDEIRAGSKLKSFAKAAAAAWKKVEDKSEWQQMAEEDKMRYEREMKEFNGNK